MIDIKLLDTKIDGRNPFFEKYKQDLDNRGFPVEKLHQLVSLNQKRKSISTMAEQKKAKQNQISAEIPVLKKAGTNTDQLLLDMKILAGEVKGLEAEASQVENELFQFISGFPNQLHSSTPKGAGAEDNVLVKKVGSPKTFSFQPREHFEIGEALGILDLERSSKVTGARFAFLRGGGARLERALIQYCLDTHTSRHGYEEMIPPYIVNSASYFGTGQFPKFADQVFGLTGTDYHLISTAEVPVTNYYRDEILAAADLPKSFAAFSPCFRSEAGAHGRDTKGLIRQHQFHKIELMTFCHPDSSYEQLEKLTSHAEQILMDLELPFQRMALCSADIGFSAAKTYDLEVWLPGQAQYREISSCSNFEDFQARRANIRFREVGGKPQFLHTLNGSGLAIGRTLIAILENYQTESGSVLIPAVLQRYFDGQKVIEPQAKKT